MRQLLILGGQSAKNHQFVLDLAVYFEKQWLFVTPFIYDHRTSGENEIDWELEIEKLRQLPLASFDMVIAKSIGTGLLAQVYQEWLLSSDVKIVLLWLPLRVARELDFDRYYDNLNGNIAIVQNEYDPTGSYQMLSGYFLSSERVKVVCVNGNETHNYEDFDFYVQLLVW